MSNLADLFLSSVSLLRLAWILLAPWLAARFEPRGAPILQGERTSPPGAVSRTLIGLGAVSTVPLFELVPPASWGLADGMLTTF